MHLHLGQPPPHAPPYSHTERDEAVRVVPVEAASRPLGAEPPVGDEGLRVLKLGLVVQDDVMTQMEQSLKRESRRTFTLV